MLNKTHGLEGSFFNSYDFDPRHELWILVGKRVKTPANPMAVTSWGSAEIQEAQLSVDQRCQTRNKNGSKRKVWAIFKRFFLLGGLEDVWRMPKMMNSATCISFRRVAIWECFARCFFFPKFLVHQKKCTKPHGPLDWIWRVKQVRAAQRRLLHTLTWRFGDAAVEKDRPSGQQMGQLKLGKSYPYPIGGGSW